MKIVTTWSYVVFVIQQILKKNGRTKIMFGSIRPNNTGGNCDMESANCVRHKKLIYQK